MLTHLAFLSLLVGGAGMAGSFFQILSPFFGAMVAGGALCMLGLLFFVALAQFLRSGNTSWVSLFLGLFSFAAVGGMAFFYFTNPISDVTTEVKDPPKFLLPIFPFQVEKGGEYLDAALQMKRDYEPAIAATQLLTYPGFEGVAVKAPPKDVYAEAMKMITSQLPEWDVRMDDEGKLHAEMEAVWSPFRFVNDIILEVRPVPHHEFDSRIELRARSRLPVASDFGMNILRLRELKVRLGLVMKPVEDKFEKQRAEWEKENAEDTAPATAPAPAATSTAVSTSTTTSAGTSTATAAATAPSEEKKGDSK